MKLALAGVVLSPEAKRRGQALRPGDGDERRAADDDRRERQAPVAGGAPRAAII